MHNELEFWLSAQYEIQINPVYQNMMHHAVPQGNIVPRGTALYGATLRPPE